MWLYATRFFPSRPSQAELDVAHLLDAAEVLADLFQ
jgi:hypothetical protein